MSMRVLIVDDNRDAADTLSMLVGVFGHETRTVYGGADAVAVASRFHPHLVLLDLGMPEMDGFAVCRRLREETWSTDTSIVAVTGWGREEDRAATRAAGFTAHVTKPVGMQELECLLREAS